MQEMQVWYLGQEDLLEEEIATHSYILVWGIPWIEEPAELQSMGSQKSQTWLSNWAHTKYKKLLCPATEITLSIPEQKREAKGHLYSESLSWKRIWPGGCSSSHPLRDTLWCGGCHRTHLSWNPSHYSKRTSEVLVDFSQAWNST